MWNSGRCCGSYLEMTFNNKGKKKKTRHKWNRENRQHLKCHPTFTNQPINYMPKKEEQKINYSINWITRKKKIC